MATIHRIKHLLCKEGHKFHALPDHPFKDGKPRCPHCMDIELTKHESAPPIKF